MDHDITNLGLDITFLCETDVFGQMQEIELKPNGRNITVSEENKVSDHFVIFGVVNLQKTSSLHHMVWDHLHSLDLSRSSKRSFYPHIRILPILVLHPRYLLVPVEGTQITRMSLRVYLEPHKFFAS